MGGFATANAGTTDGAGVISSLRRLVHPLAARRSPGLSCDRSMPSLIFNGQFCVVFLRGFTLNASALSGFPFPAVAWDCSVSP